MTTNDNEYLDKLADAICDKIEAKRREWWVEPELHYNQHKELTQILEEYKQVKSLFLKIFLRFAIVGAVVLSLIGASASNLTKFIK